MRSWMAALSPAPSTIRARSLVTLTVLACAEHLDLGIGQGHAEVLVDDLRAGDGGDVLEDALAAVAEARGLDGHGG